MAAFPGAALVAALLGFDPRAGALFIGILVGGVIWHATILRFVRERNLIPAVLRAYLLSGALASAAAIAMVLAKTPAGLYTIGHGRAIGTFVLPGELAGYLILYVPVAFAVARAQVGMRALAAAGLAFAAVAFVLTFSRAGWMGMAAALAALVMLRRKGTRIAIAIVGAAIVVVLLAFNAHHDPSENFTRLSIWSAALRTIALFPFSGVGPFEFAHVYPFLRVPDGEPVAYHAHSIVLTIAAETGLVGVAALFFGWWRFVAELRSALRAQSAFGSVAAAIAAGLLGTWVQGTIDTISVVLFGLWLPFMALALACAASDAPEPRARVAAGVPRAGRRAAVAAAACVLVPACAFVQLASSAVYARAAAPASLPAHLPAGLGTRMYELAERIAPLPLVEAMLAEDALRRGDVRAAAAHAARLPAGVLRSDLQARVAAAQGRPGDAIRSYLDAGDDEALTPVVDSLAHAGRVREAYELERRIAARFAATGTRPNALADSWWRLGRLATRLGDRDEAARDYERAIALAPLNTKYLLEAGVLELERKNPAAAQALFTRASRIDTADADAVAGAGLAALQRGDKQDATALSAQAGRVNPRATLERRLNRALRRAWLTRRRGRQ